MNTRFTVVRASDADEGSNAELTYIADSMGEGGCEGWGGGQRMKWGLCGEGGMGEGGGREGRQRGGEQEGRVGVWRLSFV